MLKKLLKYDLKNIYKVLIVFYILAFVFALLTRIFFSFDNSTIATVLGCIASGTLISMIVNIIINSLIRVWARFVNNLYGDESYLTHTLPVSKKTIYLSKFTSSVITMFTSILVILIVCFIAYYSKTNLEILKSSLSLIASIYDSTIVKLLLVIFFIFFLEMTFALQSGFTGIILGHMSNNNKTLKSVFYGFLTFIAFQLLTLLILFIVGLFNTDVMNLFLTNNIVNIDIIKSIMYVAIAVYLLYIVACYLINTKLFMKGVNVD